MGKRWLKRAAWFLAVMLVVLVGVVLTYPYWLPHVARPVATRFGASFGAFERLEGGRFGLSDIEFTNRSVRVEVARAEGFLPHVWYRRKHDTNATFLEVNGWKVYLVSGGGEKKPGTSGTNRTVVERFQKLEEKLALGREWLPKATLLNGTVIVKGREYTLPLVTWDHGQLNADGFWPENAIPVEIKGRLSDEPYQLSYAMHPLDLRVRVQAWETNNGVAARVTGFYKDNRVDGNAFFAPDDSLLPETATLTARDFNLPAELLKLQGYRELTGSLRGQWRTNQYAVSLNARAEPTGDAQRPAVDLQFEASGDTNHVRVEKLLSTAPGLELALSSPVEVGYSGQMLGGQAELEIDADLAKLPWGKLEGEMNATILLKPGGKLPRISFRARGTKLGAFKLNAESVEASGELDWPSLQDFELRAALPANGAVAVRGGADLDALVISNASVSVDGLLPGNLLPPSIRAGEVHLQAQLSGAVSNLAHAGTASVRDLSMPALSPMHLEAKWSATLVTFSELALRARAGAAALVLNGSGHADEQSTNLTIRELTLSKGDEPYLELVNPFNVRLAEGASLEIEPLLLEGMERELSMAGSLRWPSQGQLRLSARNVAPNLFQPFVRRSLRGVEVPFFRLASGWSNGPVIGAAEGEFAVEEERFGQVRARLKAGLEQGGLTLTNLSVADRAGEVLAAHGFLPLSIEPGSGGRLVRLSRREEMDFTLETRPSEHFWGIIAGLAGVELSNPAVKLALRGTVRKPDGELNLFAERIALNRTNRELPQVGRVTAQVTLSPETVRLAHFEAEVEQQRITATGDVPLGTNFWTQRREQVIAYLADHARLRVHAPEVQVAPFARLLPKYVAPGGVIRIDAGIEPGRQLAGTIEVREVQTRPISRVGVVQDIQSRVVLDGQVVRVEEISGVLGGERVGVRGFIDLSSEHLAQGYPKVDLAIRGQNVPLARNPDVILRSDLDLRVRNGTNMVPFIEGGVVLRDSFLLRDIATLVPGRVATPERRPPYFTVPQDPLDDWRLDIRVRGDEFMRVRSPFFQGVASANFHVIGTLEEPTALGEATISSGRIIFPFATLEVGQALVSLTSENPYLPRIFAVARGRAFGFDIQMQAEGWADEPVIEFSSVPALTSEQIILMLTTGQIPRDDFGFSQQDRAGKLALFLGKSLWQKLNPGKVGEERLTIRSGQDVTEQGRQTYEVEYRLTDRWALVGEYDRFGALNANVKWRLLSK